jgi:hypothetical protein
MNRQDAGSTFFAEATVRTTSFLLGAILAATVACGDDDPASPTPNSMSATLDGAAWTAATLDASYFSNVIEISGVNAAGVVIVIAAANVTGAGTYSVAPGNTHGALANVITDGPAFWASNQPGGSGSITFSSITESAVIGTFSFVAVGIEGAAGTRTVTNGRFNIPIN